MTETQIEKLVVRLVGDGQSYVKMLQDATKSTQEAAKKVEESTGKIEKMRHSLESLGGTATKVFGAVGIGLSFKAMYDMWDRSDDLITELTTVIKMNGGAVDEVLPKYRAFAKEMAAVTTSSKEAVLEMMKQAEVLGLSGERAQKAVKNAITLGAIKDANPNSFMRQAVNFEKTGNASGLARILGLMGEMEEDTTKAAEAAKLLEKNWDYVITKGEDGSAKLQRSLNEIKEMGKEAGKIIGSVVEPLIDHVASAVKWFQTLNPIVKSTVVTILLLTAAIEPAILAMTFMGGRIAAIKLAMFAMMSGVGDLALKMWTLTYSIQAMTAAEKMSMFLKGGATVIALAAIAGAYLMVARAQEQLNEAMRKGAEIQSKIEQANKTIAGSFSTVGQHDLNVQGKNEALNAAKAAKEEADKPVNLFQLIGANAERAKANKELEDATKLYEIAKDARDKFVKSLEETKGPSVETIKAIQDLESSIKLQQETMGMTSEQVKVYELRIKANGDAALMASLDIAEYNLQLLDQAKAQDSAIKSAKEYAKQLQFEIDTFGMDEDAARLKKLEMEGVDAATIKQIDTLQRQKYMLESVAAAEEMSFEAVEKKVEAYRAIDAMRAGSAASRTAVFAYQNRFGDDAKSEQKQTNRLLTDAVDVLQQIRDKEAIQVEEDALA